LGERQILDRRNMKEMKQDRGIFDGIKRREIF
jgi:hypothetical protein